MYYKQEIKMAYPSYNLAEISLLTEALAQEIIRCHLTWHGEVEDDVHIELSEFLQNANG